MKETRSINGKIQTQPAKVIPHGILWPFMLLTGCFALWGFANDVTNPMVKAFSKIMLMSNFEGSLTLPWHFPLPCSSRDSHTRQAFW
jgi:hypothetical protein